jgi:hypothetical protein
MWMNKSILGGLALLMISGTASAQDAIVYGGAELEFLFEEDGPGSGTNSYVSGYVEVEVNGIYGGLWGEVASDEVLNEVNLYFGYRNETAAGLGYNLYYTRYYYPNDGGDCCGEISLELDLPVGEKFTASAEFYYVPEYDDVPGLGSAYLGGAWTVTDAVELSALYGTYEVDGAGNEDEWEIGATYYIGDETAVDLRWYDGTEYVDGYVGLSLTWDTTLLGG